MANILQQFSELLNELTREDLMYNTLMNHDWLLKNAKKDPNWAGGKYIVPFIGYGASTVMVGSGLPAVSEINQTKAVRGYIEDQQQIKGSLKFFEKDIRISERYSSKSDRQTFLTSLISKEIFYMTKRMQQFTSIMMLNGYLSKATSAGSNLGVVEVNNVEVLDIGMRLVFRDVSTPAAAVGYIGNINTNLNQITVYTDPDFTTPFDFTALGDGFGAGDTIHVYGTVDLGTGVLTNQIITLRDALLSAVNGGSTTLHGVNKLDYPFLQAVNVDGSAINASNIVQTIFRAYSLEIARKGKKGATGIKANNVLVSTRLYADIVQWTYENNIGFNVVPNETKRAHYPYETITIGSTAGIKLKVIEVPELDDNIIPIIDPSTIKIISEGTLSARGNLHSGGATLYYVRSTTEEHVYVKDFEWDMNVAYLNPQANGIIYGVSY